MAFELTTLQGIKSWHVQSRIGAVLVYHNSADEYINPKTGERVRLPSVQAKFDYVRGLSDAGRVILYQHRNRDGTWDYCAQRCSHKADAWLDRMSRLTAAPHNVYAHGEGEHHEP